MLVVLLLNVLIARFKQTSTENELQLHNLNIAIYLRANNMMLIACRNYDKRKKLSLSTSFIGIGIQTRRKK